MNMTLQGKRPAHIEDALVIMHTNQWFTWTDSKNKIYANLRLTEKYGGNDGLIDNEVTELPTESELNNKLKEMQDAWDLENTGYKKNRKSEYPSFEDQLDYIYHNGITKWKTDMIKPIKDKYPKE